MMLNHMGFACWVSSDDGTLFQTYSAESLGNVRSAWIASEAGKSFVVNWQDKSGKRIATSGHVFIDGKDVASAIIRPGRDAPVTRSGAKTRRNKIKPFVFGELSLTDDDTIASPYDASLRNVGIIKVEISRVRLGVEVPFAGYEATNHGVVHERAKKAGAHCTKFGEAKRVEKTRTVGISTAPYDPNESGPYVTFEFRYRSLEMLKATRIVQTNNNGRKRSSTETDNDDVIEIYSSEDEASSTTLHESSPHTGILETPSKKRVKMESQDDKNELCSLPASSPPLDRDELADEMVLPSTTSEPLGTQASEGIEPSQPTDAQAFVVKKEEEEEEEEEEELDMLPSESEGTLSTDPSQNACALLVDLSPLSSSPGPDAYNADGEE